MKKKTKFWLWIFLIMILFLLTVFFMIRSYQHFDRWEEHKEYFEKDKTEQCPESWMSVKLIERHFKINFEKDLGYEIKKYEQRKTLEEFVEDKVEDEDQFYEGLYRLTGCEKKVNGSEG